MNEKICITNKRKRKSSYKWIGIWWPNECQNDEPEILQALYSVHKKIGKLFFHTYLLTCLNKDASVRLKVINIWTSSWVKYKNNGLKFF